MGKQLTPNPRAPRFFHLRPVRHRAALQGSGTNPSRRRWRVLARRVFSASYISADSTRIFPVVILVLFIGLVIAFGGIVERTPTGFGERQAALHDQRVTLRQELDALDRFEDGLIAPDSVGQESVVDLIARQQLLIDGGRSRAAARLERQIAILNDAIHSGGATAEFVGGVEQHRAALASRLERLNEGLNPSNAGNR